MSIYALPEAPDSHYKMLETAEECKVKFNYVYVFTHTHQILLLTSHFSVRLLSIWFELICLMKKMSWHSYDVSSFFSSLCLWPPFLHARCVFLQKEFLFSKYDTLQSPCVWNYTSSCPELPLNQCLKKQSTELSSKLFSKHTFRSITY